MTSTLNEHAPTPRRLRAPLFRAAFVALFLCAPSNLPCPAQEAAAPKKADDKATVKASDAPAQAAEAARAAQRPPATGSIKGRVLGEGGEPLAGVAVRAGGRSTGAVFTPPPTATTDEDGQFVLENLEPNVYTLSAEFPGYITETDTQPSPPRQRVGDTVTLRMAKGGVITGTVTDAAGDPLVGITVRVTRVRDLAGRPVIGAGGRDATTDDRGVYRSYGLQPGVYVVSAGGAPAWAFWPVPRSESAPTYDPSGTRDTATELTVRAGQETTGIDIRFRDERGQRVSGTFVIPPGQTPDEFGGVNVALVHAATGTFLASTWAQGRGDSNNSFSFEGLADGDYELTAQHTTRTGGSSKSLPLRVTVKGADVTGVKLVLAPLSSVSGTVTIETLAEAERARGECKERPAGRLLPQETAVYVRLDSQATAKGQARSRSYGSETVPDSGGSFTARNLEPGRYRVEARPVDENFYARSVQLPDSATTTTTAPAATPAPKPGAAPRAVTSSTAAAARDSFELRPGQQLGGVQVRVAEGAAYLAGHVAPAEEGGQLPPQTRLYLVPAEREQADIVLRHYSATPTADGAFVFRNLAPGRYLLVARQYNIDPSDPSSTRPPFWDAAERARMRREAEAANLPVELQPCQRTTDFAVRYPQK